ncbi:MAG: SDR family oxidoreductase [candidate division KSB1 bacterium]|nr:SDR family oxidoreductase [candidate division KSB1 bacterium]MDZ7272785.1 SDR family oxidoreductase [candidate division KSB1 bacterium]MDZ7284191.1 SDR family oxidoreductase [candidate division KSB1 bacterium]MDZ7297411.1 SDR family oxidoreductase [candidate division KSB1 bacterium]MDZ7306529.1 SDR family oxidoreductase [candidate division KSB1 bacterium]
MAFYLVTGGGGFIGSNLVRALLERGEHVRVLDNFATGKRANLAEFAGRLELIEGDIRDRAVVEQALAGVDYVLHQAALGSVPRSIQDPLTSNDVNVNGTLNLLWAARQARVKRFVFASSSSVYGDTPTLPKEEGMAPNPLSPYATSKLAGERYALSFWHVYRLPTVALRYFNVFGPKQDPDSQYAAVIPRFIAALKNGVPPVIFGDGEQSRDFTYIDNVVQANLLACTAPEAPGHFMNVACGERYSLNTLLQELNRIMGTNITARYESPRPGDVKHSMAAIDRAQRLLSFTPTVKFAEGLERTVAWYLRQPR